jgi:hypothetical protein
MVATVHVDEITTHTIDILSANRFKQNWYQTHQARYLILLLAALFGIWYFLQFGLFSSLVFSLSSAFLVVISKVADVWTTLLVSQLKPVYVERGLEFQFGEVNPYLPDNPGLKDLLWGRSMLFSLHAVFLALVLPPLGWGVAVSFLLVSWNNHRLYRQGQFELELYDRLTGSSRKKKRDDSTETSRLPSPPLIVRDSEEGWDELRDFLRLWL